MAQAPTCPRCGYDLSGIVASWTDSCPLTGICSECGVRFRWSEVLDARHRFNKWYVESHRASLALTSMVTLVSLAWPTLVWRRVRLEQQLRSRRLILHIIFGLVGAWLLFATAIGCLANPDWFVAVFGGWTIPPFDLVSVIDPLKWLSREWRTPRVVVFSVALYPALVGSVFVILILLFSDSVRLGRVRTHHLMRVTCLSIPTGISMGLLSLLSIQVIAVFPALTEVTVMAVFLATFLVWPSANAFAVTKHYLRFDRPVLVAVIFGVAANVISLVILFAVLMFGTPTGG